MQRAALGRKIMVATGGWVKGAPSHESLYLLSSECGRLGPRLDSCVLKLFACGKHLCLVRFVHCR